MGATCQLVLRMGIESQQFALRNLQRRDAQAYHIFNLFRPIRFYLVNSKWWIKSPWDMKIQHSFISLKISFLSQTAPWLAHSTPPNPSPQKLLLMHFQPLVKSLAPFSCVLLRTKHLPWLNFRLLPPGDHIIQERRIKIRVHILLHTVFPRLWFQHRQLNFALTLPLSQPLNRLKLPLLADGGGEGRARSWRRREEPMLPVAPMMRIFWGSHFCLRNLSAGYALVWE